MTPPRTLTADIVKGRARMDAARASFLVALPGLLAQHAGRWVVYADDAVAHAADSRKAAHAWGMLNLGPLAGFIVEKVEPQK